MINVIKGQDRTVRLTFANDDGTAYDLTGLTEMTVYLPAATTITKVYSTGGISVIGALTAGIVEFTLSDTNTGDMNVGYGQAIEIILDKGTTRKLFQVRNILNVTARLF